MRFTKENWIQKGLEFLSNEGAHALQVDHMCAKLRITKGSFYHYFEGIDEYINLVLKSWEKKMLSELDAISQNGLKPKEKLNRMASITFNHSGNMELGIRSLALYNKRAKSILTKVELKRLEILSNILREIGVSKQKASELAEVTYTAWIGIQVCQNGEVINREQAIKLTRETLTNAL